MDCILAGSRHTVRFSYRSQTAKIENNNNSCIEEKKENPDDSYGEIAVTQFVAQRFNSFQLTDDRQSSNSTNNITVIVQLFFVII